MTKNESKLLSIQGIAKASAFCLLLSAFSVNAAMAAPAPAGTVDEVMAVQQGKKVTGVVVDGTGEPVIGANVVVKGTTNGRSPILTVITRSRVCPQTMCWSFLISVICLRRSLWEANQRLTLL